VTQDSRVTQVLKELKGTLALRDNKDRKVFKVMWGLPECKDNKGQ
jgi:hypothetical protein